MKLKAFFIGFEGLSFWETMATTQSRKKLKHTQRFEKLCMIIMTPLLQTIPSSISHARETARATCYFQHIDLLIKNIS